jgi:hypothetical protein
MELKICYAKVVSLSAVWSSRSCCVWKMVNSNSFWTPCGWGTVIVYDTVYMIPIVRTSRSYGDAVSNSVHGSFYTGPVKGVTWWWWWGYCLSNIVRRFRVSGCLCLSVHLSAWNIWLRLNLFFTEIWNEYFSKSCRKTSSLIKIWEENGLPCMKTYVYSWSYLAEFFLEKETFQTKGVGKPNNTFYMLYYFFPEDRGIYELMWKNTVEIDRPQITICNTAHALYCWVT